MQLKEKTLQQIEEVNKSFTAVHNITSIKSRTQRESVSTETLAHVKVCTLLCALWPTTAGSYLNVVSFKVWQEIFNPPHQYRFLIQPHLPFLEAFSYPNLIP